MKRTTMLFANGKLLQTSALLLAAFTIAVILIPVPLSAQSVTVVKDRSTAISKQAQNLSLIPVQYQPHLSSAQERLLYLNTVMHGPAAGPKIDAAQTASLAPARALPAGPIPGPYLRVSDPRLDYGNSVMTSFTQSETSSAWCGNTVVVVYNDSGAFARTAGVNYYGPWSFSSVSYSTDRGATFTEAGYMNPGPYAPNFLAGDPVVACTSPSQFYQSSIFASGQDASGNFFNGVAVNASSDGGKTWGPPVAAVAKDFNHSIDKPWIAADPTHPSRLAVTYTDFDFTGFAGDPSAVCPGDLRYAIELVVSNDGGTSWGLPVTVHQECYYASGGNGVQGSNPAFSADGSLYIAYEFFPGTLPNNEIHLAKSIDHGQSVLSDVKVSDVWPNGNFGLLQGSFRNNEFPQVAVDRSSRQTRGNVYVSWSDGAANIVADLPLVFGSYAYPDVRVARSTDGGITFAAPVTVSPTPSNFTGRGRDQFFPGIAVDRRGRVGVCYYDRRQRADNSRIDRYCSTSENAGSSWDEEQASEFGWIPAHATDGVINPAYIGDYDSVSSDFLLQQNGFFSSFEVQFNGNPDVLGYRMH
jgi:hypothetical protein